MGGESNPSRERARDQTNKAAAEMHEGAWMLHEAANGRNVASIEGPLSQSLGQYTHRACLAASGSYPKETRIETKKKMRREISERVGK